MVRQIFTVVVVVLASIGIQVTWAFNDINIDEPEGLDRPRADWSWLTIFPGTHWCGAGNNSEDNNSLGKYAETDECCRTHDRCDDFIGAGQSKHNLKNTASYTRLKCACDEEFHKCLKKVEKYPSSEIGTVYFTVLSTQCFREDYPAECAKHQVLPRYKCVKYEFDTSKPKLYQWFDVLDF